MGTGFQRGCETACRFKVAVVFLLPLAHLLELCCNGVLQQGGLLLTVHLIFDFGEYHLVALCQSHVLQRIGGDNLRLCRKGEDYAEQEYRYFNDW